MLRKPGPATSTAASHSAAAGSPRRASAIPSAISRGGRRAALASVIATGLATSPSWPWAGGASGTAGGADSGDGLGRGGEGVADRREEGGVAHGRELSAAYGWPAATVSAR